VGVSDSSRSLSGFLSSLETLTPPELHQVLLLAHAELRSRLGPKDRIGTHLYGMGGWTACGRSASCHKTGCVGEVTCGICKKTDYYREEAGQNLEE